MRSEKVAILNEVIEQVKGAEFCFIVNYGGLKVTQFTKLRKELFNLQANATVVKNSYLGKAAAEMGWEDISTMLQGPTAIVTGSGDVAEVAKALVAFIKDNKQASIKGASLEAAIISAEEVDALSKLPSKDAMRGMLLGTLQAPATSLVRVLNAPLLNLLYALKAYEEQKGGDGEQQSA